MVWTIRGRSKKGKPGHWTAEAIPCCEASDGCSLLASRVHISACPQHTQCNRTARERPGLSKLNTEQTYLSREGVALGPGNAVWV